MIFNSKLRDKGTYNVAVEEKKTATPTKYEYTSYNRTVHGVIVPSTRIFFQSQVDAEQ